MSRHSLRTPCQCRHKIHNYHVKNKYKRRATQICQHRPLIVFVTELQRKIHIREKRMMLCAALAFYFLFQRIPPLLVYYQKSNAKRLLFHEISVFMHER